MSKKIFILAHQEARSRAIKAVKDAPDGHVVMLDEPRRSLEANAAMWPILEAIANQCELCVNGLMEKATAEDWKDVLTATYRAEMRVAVFKGRMILLGMRTSRMGKKQFSEWLSFLDAMAAEMGVTVYEGEA